MSRSLKRIPLILGCLTVASTCAGQTFSWESLAPADAVAAVRSFEQNQNLNATVQSLSGVMRGDPGMYAQSQLYTVDTPRYVFGVSKFSHLQITRHDKSFDDKASFYGRPYDPYQLAPLMISQAAAWQTANSFVLSHHPLSTNLQAWKVSAPFVRDARGNMTPFREAYTFTFYQDLGNGVEGPSRAIVSVDSVMGQVTSYYQVAYPTLASSTASITGDQAVQAAINSVLNGQGIAKRVENLFVTPPDAMGVEILAYHVSFQEVSDGPLSTIHSADVSAYDGSVIYDTQLQGAGSRIPVLAPHSKARKTDGHLAKLMSLKFSLDGVQRALAYPPLLIHGTPYLYVRYLCYGGALNSIGKPSRNSITLLGKSGATLLRFNSRSCEVFGSKIQLCAPPTTVDGRVYVPLQLFERILPLAVTYDRSAGVVSLAHLRNATR